MRNATFVIIALITLTNFAGCGAARQQSTTTSTFKLVDPIFHQDGLPYQSEVVDMPEGVNDCQVFHALSDIPRRYPQGLKVCVYSRNQDLRFLLAHNTQPRILVVAHGAIKNKGWVLGDVHKTLIPVEEILNIHPGIVAVYSCRSAWGRNSYVWRDSGPIPDPFNPRLITWAPEGATLRGSTISAVLGLKGIF